MRKENARLKRIVTELELGKLILNESLEYLKSKDQSATSEALDADQLIVVHQV